MLIAEPNKAYSINVTALNWIRALNLPELVINTHAKEKHEKLNGGTVWTKHCRNKVISHLIKKSGHFMRSKAVSGAN